MKHSHKEHEHEHEGHHNHAEHEHHVGHAYHEEQVEKGIHDDHAHHDHHNHGGGGHAHHNHGSFKELFLKSLPLGIIVMLLSPMFGFQLPFQFTFPYSDIVVAILSTILIIYGGRPFFKGQ